jgi:hypothetical protein
MICSQYPWIVRKWGTRVEADETWAVIGSVDLTIRAWRLRISCLWCSNDKGEWISLPTDSFTNRDGKKIYKHLVEFTDKQAYDRFQGAALAAVKNLHEGRSA